MSGQQGVAGHDVRPPIAVRADLAPQLHGAEARRHHQRLVPVGDHTARRLASAIARHGLSIELLPLPFQQPPQHALPDAGHQGFDPVQGRVQIDRHRRQIEAAEFGHLLLILIVVDLADNDA